MVNYYVMRLCELHCCDILVGNFKHRRILGFGFLQKRSPVCVGDSVTKRGAGRRHNCLYIRSPDGAYNIIFFRNAVILCHQVRVPNSNGRRMEIVVRTVLKF